MVQATYSFDQVGQKRSSDEHHRGGVRQKYILDEPSRNLIRAVYGNPEYGRVEESIQYLVEKIGAPRSTIRSWASRLGLQRTRDDYWTEADIEYLQAHIEKSSIASIAKHLGRTQTAIRVKAKRLKFHRVPSDNYSARGLADALGCDRRTVGRWIERGLLHARWDHERDQWSITPQAVRTFIIAYPREVDHRRADWLFLLDILVGSDEIGKIKAKKGN